MFMLFSRVLLVCAGIVSFASATIAADLGSACPTAQVPALAVPRVKQALAANSELTIVALGSSSTQGWHSTSIAQSYPAILQAELAAALPQAHVAVINRGIGGQDAIEMSERLEADVLNVRPVLVIWQVGANGAMKRVDTDVFRDLVFAGVKRLQEAGSDVILMDNQRAPAILASPRHVQIGQALADVATQSGAGLFGRGALMDQWKQDGHPFADFVSDDGIHHNDHGYKCVAKALATSILDGLGVRAPFIRSASVRR